MMETINREYGKPIERELVEKITQPGSNQLIKQYIEYINQNIIEAALKGRTFFCYWYPEKNVMSEIYRLYDVEYELETDGKIDDAGNLTDATWIKIGWTCPDK